VSADDLQLTLGTESATPRLLAEIDGVPVPLDKCDWVLWGPCGCPFGVTVARYAPTEEAAWKAMYDYKREIDKAKQQGCRVELMTHERWGREVMPAMQAGCKHGPAGGAR
jgi:hypothetical protein